MHRDYRQNGPTTIIQYPDRIEFFNHGYSLKPVDTYGEYGNSKTRNQTIAAVLHDTEYAENKGTGIPKIRNYLKKANLEEPRFVSDKDNNTFSVTFYLHQLEDDGEKVWLSQFNSMDLTSEELRILVFAHKNRTVSNEQGREMTGMDTIHVSQLLTGLRKKGVLVQHSAGPKTYYTIPDVLMHDGGIDPLNTKTSALDTKINPLDTKINPLNSEITSDNTLRQELLGILPEHLRSEITGQNLRVVPETAEELVYEVCRIKPFSAREIAVIFDKRRYWAKEYIRHLLAKNKLSLSIPDKPNSRYQAYYANPDNTDERESQLKP